MKTPAIITLLFTSLIFTACDFIISQDDVTVVADSSISTTLPVDNKVLVEEIFPDTGRKLTGINDTSLFKINRQQFVNYAKTLTGTPYVYAATNPAVGFDCSGFITYVFNHFDLAVPRSSVDFTNYGREVSRRVALPGDLILFTGTNPEERVVGHMGIIVDNSDSLRFIHSTSGRAMAVTTSALSDHYMERFVKVIRVIQ